MRHPPSSIRHSAVSRWGVVAVALVSTGLLAGCFPSLPVADPEVSASAPAGGGGVDAEASVAPSGASGDVFAEREQFFADQQQPVDGTVPTAKTAAQKEFIAQQRAYTEQQGGTWSDQAEGIALALSLDACETSILNEHSIDTSDFQTHVSTSPLIAQIAGDNAQAVAGAASIMVFGTQFLCPADAAQWTAAYRATFPS